MADRPHVALFQHHEDGTATVSAWHVDEKYAADMLGYMGEPDGETVLSPDQVAESIASSAANESWLFRDADHG